MRGVWERGTPCANVVVDWPIRIVDSSDPCTGVQPPFVLVLEREKKGLKGPSSGRYDLFVPRASRIYSAATFSDISILKNFTHD